MNKNKNIYEYNTRYKYLLIAAPRTLINYGSQSSTMTIAKRSVLKPFSLYIVI